MRIDNPRKIKKFNHEVFNFHILDDPNDRIGILYIFQLPNMLGVSVADHSGIEHNDVDMVSVAVLGMFGAIINDNEKLDGLIGTQQGVALLERSEVEDFITTVAQLTAGDMLY